MVTPVLSLLVGCWISEDALEERLDQDGDGVPVDRDCNDTDADITRTHDAGLFEQVLGCGQEVEGSLEPGGPTFSGITTCAHPFKDDELLGLGTATAGVVVEVEQGTEVRLSLTSTAFSTQPYYFPDLEDPVVALVAFKGPVCDLDSCVIGYPFVEPGDTDLPFEDVATSIEVELSVSLDPAERLYTVISGQRGTWRLQVECVP